MRTNFCNQLRSFSSNHSSLSFFLPPASALLGSPAARGFRDESRLHANCGRVQPGPLGQWHPVVASVHSRRDHLCAGRERAARLSCQPEDDSL